MRDDDPTCAAVAALVDELVDGELDAARTGAIEAHLPGCPRCHALVEDTRRLVAAMARLAVDRPEPPPALWTRIEAVAAEREGRRSRLWWWWHAWQRRVALAALAMAAVGASVLVALDARHARHGRVVESLAGARPAPAAVAPLDLAAEADAAIAAAEAEYARAVDDVTQLVLAERATWRAPTAQAFDETLAAMDVSVARALVRARAAPRDAAAIDAVHAAFRRKLLFLQEAAVRGERWAEGGEIVAVGDLEVAP